MAGLDVFEFGCGTGCNLEAVLKSGACSARPRADVFQHDLSTPLPAPSASVDFVHFCLSLEHVATLDTPLREAGRILRPSGRICIIEIHPLLSLSGVAAHFEDAGQEIRMPTFPHSFSGYCNAFSEAGFDILECREWRPADFGAPAESKALKRGPHMPLTVSFTLLPHAQ